ncbi:MAG: GAF domain-containing protein [Myxococcales bacterium]|nr:MAG: GAF domain-containing protein [Myxococcales bacterium]
MSNEDSRNSSGAGPGGPSTSRPTIDLTNCDREPIHIPGAIQPHGLLLALAGRGLTIVQVSVNTLGHLGRSARELLGRGLHELLEPEGLAAVQEALAADDPRLASPLRLRTREDHGAWSVDGILHRSGDLVVLELEPAHDPPPPRGDLYTRVRGVFGRLQRGERVADLCQLAVGELAALTGFDRVMAYRFDRDDHGHVIAETRQPEMEPFLDLHYPASDIPVQARRLYTINRLRLIVDAGYGPTPLLALDPAAAPLDLSLAVLRSVSPVHVQYLRNMGVHASMSVSLVVDGRLWGMLLCHHNAPRFVPYEVRAACEFLGQALSWQVAARERAEAFEQRASAQATLARIVERLAGTDRLVAGLQDATDELLGLVDAAGAAVRTGGVWTRLGQAPSEAELEGLARELAPRLRHGVLSTESLAGVSRAASAYADVASGALAVSLGPDHGDLLVWFRPERVQTVNWAGDPRKLATVVGDETRLSPRGSFALWSEIVRGRSLAWQPWQLEAAADLQRAVVGHVLRRNAELLDLNAQLSRLTAELSAARDQLEARVHERTASLSEARDDLARHARDLTRSNQDLEQFAYVASHDLQEPLRMVVSYVQLLARRYRGQLDADADTFIDFAVDGVTRMQSLISDLLAYSRLGREEPPATPVDLEAVLERTLADLSTAIAESGAVVTHDPLPRVVGHASQLGQLLQNLIGNALKFHGSALPRVHITATRDEEKWAIAVSDEGIGIPAERAEDVFVVFRRLHSRSEYPGSGVGLAISKKIVENHGGTIRVQSGPGPGATFVFTLLDPKEP